MNNDLKKSFPFQSLRDFMEYLEQNNDLIRINHPVSINLQITEIHKRVINNQGPALLFEKPIMDNGEISNIPLLANLFGTTDRVAQAIGAQEMTDLREIGQLLAYLKQPKPPKSLSEIAELMPIAKKVLAMKPKMLSNAPSQEVVLTGDDIDLYQLPIQWCWPNEPAQLITWPIVITKKDDSAGIDNYNLGIYRMQVSGKNQTLMRWLKHRGGAQHAHNYKNGGKMELAVAIGADPSTIVSAVVPTPDTLSEYQFSGLLRGKAIELVQAKTVDLKVPAHAEIILEGYVDLNDLQAEGPYGDHTGYYNSVEKFPTFHITAITRRKDPIYLSTFTSRPPDEPSVLGEALNELFVPLLQQQFPEIVDFYLPPEGCSYRIAIISIKKTYAGQARRVMMGLWSFLRQFLYTKYIIIVDEDINVRSWDDVMWAISTRTDPVRDTMLVENTPIDYLDFASPVESLGGKMGLDATNKIGSETNREWGEVLDMDDKTKQQVDDMWSQIFPDQK